MKIFLLHLLATSIGIAISIGTTGYLAVKLGLARIDMTYIGKEEKNDEHEDGI